MKKLLLFLLPFLLSLTAVAQQAGDGIRKAFPNNATQSINRQVYYGFSQLVSANYDSTASYVANNRVSYQGKEWQATDSIAACTTPGVNCGFFPGSSDLWTCLTCVTDGGGGGVDLSDYMRISEFSTEFLRHTRDGDVVFFRIPDPASPSGGYLQGLIDSTRWAPKHYVDSLSGLYLPLAGGQMTGNIGMPTDGTINATNGVFGAETSTAKITFGEGNVRIQSVGTATGRDPWQSNLFLGGGVTEFHSESLTYQTALSILPDSLLLFSGIPGSYGTRIFHRNGDLFWTIGSDNPAFHGWRGASVFTISDPEDYVQKSHLDAAIADAGSSSLLDYVPAVNDSLDWDFLINRQRSVVSRLLWLNNDLVVGATHKLSFEGQYSDEPMSYIQLPSPGDINTFTEMHGNWKMMGGNQYLVNNLTGNSIFNGGSGLEIVADSSSGTNGQVLTRIAGTGATVGWRDPSGGTTTNALTAGTGLNSTGTFNGSTARTFSIDATVATLTGSQTLTNKTLTSPVINSGSLGSSTATTQSAGDNSTKVATTAYVDNAVSTFSGSSARETITQASHGFVAGDVLKHAGGVWAKAQADSDVNAEALGIIESSTTNTFVIVYSGKITLTGLTAETNYFLSSTSAGTTTTTKPSAAGTVIQPAFRAISTTVAIVQVLKSGVTN